MSKIGKFWLFGKQDEPAEDFDVDYDNIYYEDRPTANVTDESAETVVEAQPLFGEEVHNTTYVEEVSEDESANEEEEVEEIEEPLYKVVFAPESYRDSAEIVDSFKIGRVTVIDVADLSREDFVRLLDYVMGAVQALDGELVRISRDVVALFPEGVDTDIDIDEIEDEPEDYFDGEEDGE